MSYRLLNSTTVYQGKVFRVRVDDVQPPSGDSIRLDVVEHPGSVAIVPIDHQDHIWFVRQYRHPTNEVILELPAGTLSPAEEPESCAVRECREEIGMTPGTMQNLGGFYIAPGYSTEYMHLFLARDLKPSPLPADKDEDLEVARIPLSKVEHMMARGELRDAKTIAALAYILNRMGKPNS